MRKQDRIRILLVSGNLLLRNIFRSELKAKAVNLDVVSAISEIAQQVIRNKYHGILVESSLLTKLKKEDRPMVDRYREIFFFSRIQLNSDNKDISIFPDKEEMLLDVSGYIERANKEEPRQFRSQLRKPIPFNLKISKIKKDSPGYNAQGGCFIFTEERFVKGSRIKVIFKELTDKTPVICRIVWKSKGKENFRPPGIGVYFESITDKQIREFFSYLLMM